MSSDQPFSRSDLAENRTELAEDRTLLASERTFSGWARTAMASIGIAIGLNALFEPVEPTWPVKGLATLFLLLAAFLAVAAERRASAVRRRLTAHEVDPISVGVFRAIAAAVVVAAAGLTVVLWWLA